MYYANHLVYRDTIQPPQTVDWTKRLLSDFDKGPHLSLETLPNVKAEFANIAFGALNGTYDGDGYSSECMDPNGMSSGNGGGEIQWRSIPAREMHYLSQYGMTS
jgi:hypothetical protein